jgi:hypothetical protein
MKRGAHICVLGGVAAGFRSRRRTIIAVMATMALLPIDVSDAGRLAHTAKNSSRHGKSPKHVSSPKRHTVRLAEFGFHLFTAVELRNHFSGCFDIEDLRGLDLFHCRFTPDSRWNPVRSLGDSPLADELDRLEKACAARPEFMDRAAHLLLIARSRRGAAPKAGSVALA